MKEAVGGGAISATGNIRARGHARLSLDSPSLERRIEQLEKEVGEISQAVWKLGNRLDDSLAEVRAELSTLRASLESLRESIEPMIARAVAEDFRLEALGVISFAFGVLLTIVGVVVG